MGLGEQSVMIVSLTLLQRSLVNSSALGTFSIFLTHRAMIPKDIDHYLVTPQKRHFTTLRNITLLDNKSGTTSPNSTDRCLNYELVLSPLTFMLFFLFFFILGWSLQKSLRLRHRMGMKFDRNAAPIYRPSSTPSASQFPRRLASRLLTSTRWPCTQHEYVLYNSNHCDRCVTIISYRAYIRATYGTVIHFTDLAPGIDILMIVIYWELF